MPRLKKYVSLFLIFSLFTILCCACSSDSSLKGTWKLTGVEGDLENISDSSPVFVLAALLPDMEAYGASITMTFTDDQLELAMSMLDFTDKETISYTRNGNTIVTEGATIKFSISGNTLKVFDGDASMVFTKEK